MSSFRFMLASSVCYCCTANLGFITCSSLELKLRIGSLDISFLLSSYFRNVEFFLKSSVLALRASYMLSSSGWLTIASDLME